MTGETIAPPPKKRYEWIDNARVIAALVVMYVHLPLALPPDDIINNGVVKCFVDNYTYHGMVAVFLVFSGYLFGRNATWSKAWERFIWILIPFVLWNLIVWGCRLAVHTHAECTVFQVMGIGAVFDSSIVISPAGAVYPVLNPPSWYLRDMLPLALLTPVLVRYRRYLPMVVLLTVLLYHGDWRTKSEVMLSPGTVCFYLIGICLTRFKIEDAYRVFTERFTPVVMWSFLAVCCACIAYSVLHLSFWRPASAPVGMLFGAMMIAHCGVLIERRYPRLSKKMSTLGTASFLVFMIHWPIFHVVARLFPAITHSLWVLLLPLPVFAAIIGLYKGMHRLTPWLLPVLAYERPKREAR